MVIYLDENLPPQLAEGLNKLQEPLNLRLKTNYEVRSIQSVFGRGVKDEEWIPRAGQEKAIAITRDFKIQTTRHQQKLCEENGLGIFFFTGIMSGLTYWQLVKALIEKWENIIKTISENQTPFAFRVTQRGSKFERLDT
jgi:hypothetical protein